MRTALVALLSLLATAAQAANIWFDPPNPDSRTPVVAHVNGAFFACPVETVVPEVHGQTIDLNARVTDCGATTRAYGFPPVDLGVLPAGVYTVRAGQEPLLILYGEATLTVKDALATFDVEPAAGSVSGDRGVRIVGHGSPRLISCLTGPSPVVCSYPVVKFDGIAAELVSATTETESGESKEVLTVRLPPHPAGTVDVTLEWPTGMVRSVAAFHYAATDESPDPAFFTPVLFPVVFSGPGAYGSKWTTELSLWNGADYPVNGGSIFDVLCFPVCDMRPQAHTSTLVKDATVPGGYLFYFERRAAPKLSFGTLVRDLSRQSQDLGTEIPVIREDELFGGRFSILNVPTDPNYRVTLRAYRLDGNGMRLRVYPMFSGASALLERPLFLPSQHGFASTTINDLVAAYPELAGKGPLRIELDSEANFRGAWGFVSITNNETQHVTVLTPQ